jgi:uncharacterized protein
VSIGLARGPRRIAASRGGWRACLGLLIWLAWAWLGPAFAQQPVAVPALSARVTDLTGTLDAAQRQRLDAQLADIERRKGTQVAILIVPTTQPETIEEFGIRVADAWKLGRGRDRAQRDTGNPRAGAIDDGLLLLVAKNDRKVRLEVGYGLEGAIPDAVAKRIIGEAITPRFRAGDFAGGLEAAVADVSRRLEGEDLPPPWQPGPSVGDDAEIGLLPLVFGAFIVGLFVSQVAGRFIGAVVGGGGAGLGATATLASTGLGAAVGVGVGLLVLFMGGRKGGGGPGGPLQRVGRRTIGHGPIIVPGSGWGGGRGGGGGGFGGGGFGGGGGGFGGGGASGDW